MNFVVGFSRTSRQLESIWVIVDRLTKSAHILLVNVYYLAEEYAKLYFKEIMKLHGGPLPIISNREALCTSHFWRSFKRGLGTQVKISTTFYPQTNAQEKVHHSKSRRHVQGLCDRFQRELG